MGFLLSGKQRKLLKPAAIALGNFDGLHIGHMKLIKILIEEAKRREFVSVVYTIIRTEQYVRDKTVYQQMLMTHKQRCKILEDVGIEYIYTSNFTKEFSEITAEKFVRDILIKKLHMKLVVVGSDYRFGFNKIGDVRLLKDLANKYNFEVIVVEKVKNELQEISSTLIRGYIRNGMIEKANLFLGRLYSLEGKVISGEKIGRKIGFPTANLNIPINQVLPANGVYFTRTRIDGNLYNSITNIGVNPTINRTNSIKVETHIIDFNRDIYDKQMEVIFIKKIRNEEKFSNLDELITQINKDVCAVKLINE